MDSIQEVEEEIGEAEDEEAEVRRYVEFTINCTYYPNGYLPDQEPTAQAGTDSPQAEGQVE